MSRRQLALIALVSAIVILVTALVVVSCGGGGTTTTAAAATTTAAPTTTAVGASATDGAALYATNCAGCHKNPPSASAAAVQTVVESGKEDMPAFKDKLTAEEIAAIVSYVTSGGN